MKIVVIRDFNTQNFKTLATALEIKNSNPDSTIFSITIGDSSSIEAARDSIYRGADSAYIVGDTTASSLERAIEKIGGADIIIYPDTLIDGAFSNPSSVKLLPIAEEYSVFPPKRADRIIRFKKIKVPLLSCCTTFKEDKATTAIVKTRMKKIISCDDQSIQQFSQILAKIAKDGTVVVAGGYGMGSSSNFSLLHTLADRLNYRKAEVGATRAAIDAGYTNGEKMIGATGITVTPGLYIACGISGAAQHTCGMKDSGTVVSINIEPNAPMNCISDYIITGDAIDIISKIISSL